MKKTRLLQCFLKDSIFKMDFDIRPNTINVELCMPKHKLTVGQGPIALAVVAGGGGMDIFTLIYPFSSFSLSLGDGPI